LTLKSGQSGHLGRELAMQFAWKCTMEDILEAQALARERGKKAGESYEVEFLEVMAKKGQKPACATELTHDELLAQYAENDKTIFWKLAREYNLSEKMIDGYAIQAETAGEGIESNRLKLKGVDLYVFYVIEINTWKYLKLEDMKLFVKDLGLKTVPIVDDNFILNHSVDQLLELADGPSYLNESELREGYVYRLYDSTEKITFKTVSNKYLIKHGL
jgi:hypothetical protein